MGGGDWSADRIVPDAVRALTTGGSLQIRHPEAVRPWQHVLDALAGYLQLATAVGTHPDDFAGAWNFGPTTGDYTVADVIRALSNAWGDAPTLVGAESSPFEQPVLRLDASKARTRLGWAPRLGFEETMRLTADWYRAYASGADAFQLTNQQIANRLHISPHTVNFHLRRIYRKLAIGSRVHLAQLVRVQRETELERLVCG